MKKSLVIVLLVISCDALQAQENLWILGEWKGTNKSLRLDGSGEYDVLEDLTLKVTPTLEGFGHNALWYKQDGSFLGASIRTYQNDSIWTNHWLNMPDQLLGDSILWHVEKNAFRYESSGEDNFGVFEIKRVHEYDPKSEVYTYKHTRKYEGRSSWLIIDEFEMKRIK
ncbi:hypothetical protein [Fulvivirga lutea]|uniref:DUF1579 domain-containing protein n=1 Tax=Fulvivirga lutea TaxID=2810512 RepID=A0A974WF95_9BACT|nr:hypothetical protein [Fulvivirga lutea]QSE97378.1 hypothetical protein JR347_17620 [Fulvivirga lutea]